MPVFYFHFQNSVTNLDHQGVELPDVTAARSEAILDIAEMLRDDAMDTLWSGLPLRLWVTEGAGGTGKTLVELSVAAQTAE
jgi:hypothetical protein